MKFTVNSTATGKFLGWFLAYEPASERYGNYVVYVSRDGGVITRTPAESVRLNPMNTGI